MTHCDSHVLTVWFLWIVELSQCVAVLLILFVLFVFCVGRTESTILLFMYLFQSDASDIDLQNVTFAPKDVTPISLTAKDNVHGLGYSGLDPRSALPATHVNLFERAAVRSSKSGKGIRGQVMFALRVDSMHAIT